MINFKKMDDKDFVFINKKKALYLFQTIDYLN